MWLIPCLHSPKVSFWVSSANLEIHQCRNHQTGTGTLTYVALPTRRTAQYRSHLRRANATMQVWSNWKGNMAPVIHITRISAKDDLITMAKLSTARNANLWQIQVQDIGNQLILQVLVLFESLQNMTRLRDLRFHLVCGCHVACALWYQLRSLLQFCKKCAESL